MKTLSPKRAEEIRDAVKAKYRKLTENPREPFSYPIGEEGARGLGYDPSWFRLAPTDVIRRFVGVGNPFKIRMPKPGDRVLDAGCGCGFDTFIAASLAGLSGRAVGIDLTAEMLTFPRAAAKSFKNGNVEFHEGSLERLPFDESSFDLVISNGVLNLVADKPLVFTELARVLRCGGALVCADLLVAKTVPQEILSNMDAWST